jgi:lysozyme
MTASRTPAALFKRALIMMVIFGLVVFAGWQWALGWAPSRQAFPVQGVDVSHHQGAIDWAMAAADGVDFAYIKASEGADLRDPRFTENWNAAAAAGIKRGAYHFFTLCKAGAEQATNFIASVPRESNAMPPAVDLEFGGNCAAKPDRAALLKEVETFIKMVEAHSEKPVMLYVTREFEEAYQISTAIDRPLWLRRMALEPNYGTHPWVMWQAHARRRVNGIDGPVDWNVLRDG